MTLHRTIRILLSAAPDLGMKPQTRDHSRIAPTSKQAGTLASPIDLCRLDDSEDADSTLRLMDDSDETAIPRHQVLPHVRS